MRKKLLILGCAMSILCSAEPVGVPLSRTGEPYIREIPNKAPVRLPQISYEGQILYVASPYFIPEAIITIRDAEGSIIFKVETALPPSSYVIVLPEEVVEQKYSIQLQYGDINLFGTF